MVKRFDPLGIGRLFELLVREAAPYRRPKLNEKSLKPRPRPIDKARHESTPMIYRKVSEQLSFKKLQRNAKQPKDLNKKRYR
jgi:hypothetical protein